MSLACRLPTAAATLFTLLVATAVSAQQPPVKPGLWQTQLQFDDPEMAARMKEMETQMKNMPPQARQQMESMLKQHGMGMAGPGSVKMCLTKEDLERDDWQSSQRESGCKTSTTRGGSTWKFHTSCPAPHASETDGEVNFASAERYTMTSTTTMDTGAGKKTTRMSGTSTWLGADCGDIKPRARPQAQAKPSANPSANPGK
jgi:hypothetical protein